MALQNTDLFIVQKVDSLEHRKVTLGDLEAYIEASPSVTFKGKVDLTDTAANNGVFPPSNGDLYINTGDGSSDASWTGITPATAVSAGDRVLWDADPGEWVLIADAADPGGQVDSIVGQTPINVDDNVVGSATAPIISIETATDPGDLGAVTIASTTDVANGTAGVVVTADQLKTTNDALDAATAGGISAVQGIDPIVTYTDGTGGGTTTMPAVGIEDASDTQKGAVRLATDAEATAGAATDVAVTPAQLAANVPDLSTEVGLSEGGTGIVAGALVVNDTNISAMTVGVAENTFAPYNFSTLPAA